MPIPRPPRRPARRFPRRGRASLSVVLLVLFGSGCLRNHLTDEVPVNPDLTIHVVIENPVGSDEKWEVQSDGRLVQEHRCGEPVRIPYLPWPANSGMIPRTLLSEELGGDREPLDVLVLGPALPRGATVRARPIGLLHVVDRLERDDKIIAVVPGERFGELRDVDELEARYPGVREILSRWYAHSRPGGGIEVQGYGSRGAANLLIADGVRAFEDALREGTMPVWRR